MELYVFGLIAFIIGNILGGIIMYQVSREKIEHILKEEKSSDNYQHAGLLFKYVRLVEVLKKSKGGYIKDSERISKEAKINQPYKALQDENNTLRIELEKAQMKNDKLIANQNDSSNSASESIVFDYQGDSVNNIQEEPSIIVNTTYFSIPQSNGSFNISNGKNKNDEDTFYLIENEENNDRGLLKYIPGELDIRAIDSIDSYLLPVCEIENITNRENASRIVLSNPGEVIKEGSNWVINAGKKVKIKFI